jgi:hypothetical protein
MTRYSASRGLLYSAPPAADEDAETADADAASDAEAADPSPADD